LKWVRADATRNQSYEQALKDRDEWTKETMLLELRTLSMSDLREAFDDNGKLKHPKEWPDSFAKVVGSLEVFEEFKGHGQDREYIGDTKKLKMWDKLKAIELIGKTIAAFTDKKEHSGSMTLEQLLLGSYTPEELAKGKNHGT
jgi:phage terminase small subunit